MWSSLSFYYFLLNVHNSQTLKSSYFSNENTPCLPFAYSRKKRRFLWPLRLFYATRTLLSILCVPSHILITVFFILFGNLTLPWRVYAKNFIGLYLPQLLIFGIRALFVFTSAECVLVNACYLIGLYLPFCVYIVPHFWGDCNRQIIRNIQLFFVKKVEIVISDKIYLYKLLF